MITNRKTVASAIIRCGKKYLLQLRDFDSEISFPGYWGLFGGSVEHGESYKDALVRELYEELELIVNDFSILCELSSDDFFSQIYILDFRIINNLKLHEGCDFGFFTLEEISNGYLFSKVFHKNFLITPGARVVFDFFSETSNQNNDMVSGTK